MATSLPWTRDRVTSAFRRQPELQSLLLQDVRETGPILGNGSYGSVTKLQFGATPCAGKKIHEALIDTGNQGAKSAMDSFLKECKLMSELRHPRIVLFMGVCLLPSSTLPVLVMELMSDCLQNILETRKNLSLTLKQSILIDVTSALVYLHSRNPPVIHRDLTARNVLIDERSMRAKVTDLGNSRFVSNQKTMTKFPGTLVYMPPEACDEHATYGDKLDMFSFGHLALYTITQVFPGDLLGPTSCDSQSGKLTPHTEVQRRRQYMQILYESLSEKHALVQLIEQCLNNAPHKRPRAMEALHWLEKLDPDYVTVVAVDRSEMADVIIRQEREIEELKKRIDSRNSVYDVLPQLPYGSGDMSGPLEKLQTTFPKMRKWRQYTFKILNQTHLKYFRSGSRKPQGEIALSTVTNVIIAHRAGGDKYCFEIHFNGNGSPWILAAFTVDERKSWMEAIRSKREPKIRPNSAYGLIPLAIESDYAEPQAAVGKPMYDVLPRHESNVAPEYDVLPLHESNIVHKPPPQSSPGPPHRSPDRGRNITVNAGETQKSTTRANNADQRQSSKNGPAQRQGKPQEGSEDPDYDRMFHSLNRKATKLSPCQIDHLISMLQNIQGPVDDNKGKNTQEEHEICTKINIIPPQPCPQPEGGNDLTNGEENPDKQRLSSSLTPPSSRSPLHHYVNYSEVLDDGREGSRSRCKVQDQGRDNRHRSISPPSRNAHFYVNYSDLLSSPPQRSRSHYNLSTAVAAEVSEKKCKHPMPAPKPVFNSKPKPTRSHLQPKIDARNPSLTLKRMLKQTSIPDSLLLTEDDPEDCIFRPQWAQANTNSRPSTLAALHRKNLYISPKLLFDITELREGQFGTVYKAEMKTTQPSASAFFKTVAIKTIPQITLDFRNEVTIMSEVVHPNIVHLYGLIVEGEMAPGIVMEYLPKGDLKSFLSRNMQCKSQVQLMKYMIDVAMGMHYLAEKGILHRDLAARNILVDEKEICKVADFGLVREVPRENMVYISSYKGPSPIRWMAPESISKRMFSSASDIWSYGILQWEMFNPTKLYPYPGLQNEEVAEKVTGGYRMPVPRQASPLVVRIMKACWNSEPNKRPSFLLISNLLTGHVIGKV